MGGELVKLLVERGNRLLEHALMGRRSGPAEVLLCAGPGELQNAAPLFSRAVLRRQLRPLRSLAARRLVLLGFYEF